MNKKENILKLHFNTVRHKMFRIEIRLLSEIVLKHQQYISVSPILSDINLNCKINCIFEARTVSILFVKSWSLIRFCDYIFDNPNLNLVAFIVSL